MVIENYNCVVRISASAPTRIDLAGGTIDIWPLYLFHAGAQTLNAAISLRARAWIEERPDENDPAEEGEEPEAEDDASVEGEEADPLSESCGVPTREGQVDGPAFAGADKVKGTDEFLDDLEDSDD